MKKSALYVLLAALVVIACLIDHSAFAQTDATLDQQIAALRADMRADKANIIDEAMQLKPEEAKAFWPVYKQYEKEMTQVNDELVALIKSYADKYGSITDAEAKQLTVKAFDVQSRKLEVKRKYFAEMSKATTPLVAAKFFQVDYRLELLLNLKLASELPALLYQAPVPAGQKSN